LETEDVFQPEVSGGDTNALQLLNIPEKLITFDVSQILPIVVVMGGVCRLEQPENKPSILVTEDVSHCEISGGLTKPRQLLNTLYIKETFDNPQFEVFGGVITLAPQNISLILVREENIQFEVSGGLTKEDVL